MIVSTGLTREQANLASKVVVGYTLDELRAIEALRLSDYYLVINDGAVLGERAICDPAKGGCGDRHPYFTYHCVELPYRGVQTAMFAFMKRAGDAMANVKVPANFFNTIPDLTRSHPMLARTLIGQENSQDVYARALGIASPISEAESDTLLDRIHLATGYRVEWRGERLVQIT